MLTLILDRLMTGRFPAVEVAEEINAIVGRATALPDGAVVLVPVRERAQPQRNATGAHLQAVQFQFAVVTLFREHADPRGEKRALRWDQAKLDLEALLAGWQPAPDIDTCALVSGEASPMGNGVSLFVQVWQTMRYLRGPIQ